MPLWTLLGLMQGKQTAPWPLTEGSDGQEGFIGMPRYNPALCTDECASLRGRVPDTRHHVAAAATRRAAGWKSITDAASFVSSALRPVLPAPWRRLPIGHLEPKTQRFDLERRTIRTDRREERPTRISAQLAYPARRCGIMQRMRVGTASVEQSILQPASAWHFFHGVTSVRRSSAGNRASYVRDAQPLANNV